MAEYTGIALQTVATGQNVTFTETPVEGGACIVHREGSGVVTLRGLTNACAVRFKVFFSANIAVPTGGTAGAVSLGISINGEALASTQMIATPAAAEEFQNVASAVYVEVPRGCCYTLGVKNTGAETVAVQNANIIITRE